VPPNLEREIHALELNLEGLLKLLGGTEDERERFWEIMKGLTTPQQIRLAGDFLQGINSQITSVTTGLSEALSVAKESQEVAV
jgi:hypothetical protein